MTKQQRQSYANSGALSEILQRTLAGRKFRLDCGHHITIGHQFSNGLVIRGNGINQPMTVICADCGM
jgi:hypothetical protein